MNNLTANINRPTALHNKHRDIVFPAGTQVTLLATGSDWVTVRHAKRKTYSAQVHVSNLDLNA